MDYGMLQDSLGGRTEFESEVISTDDPARLMRVQVRVYGLMDGVSDDCLPWATYRLPVGARNAEGFFTPVQIGDIVWVDFPYMTHGRPDTRRPRITGAVHFCPAGVPDMPPEAWSGPDALEHKRTDDEPAPASAGYHQARVFTQFGITIEWIPGGTYRITHRESGTCFELCESGDSVLHTQGDAYFSSTGKTTSEIEKALIINVLSGDTTIHTHDGNTALKSSGHITVEAGGEIGLNAGQQIQCSTSGPFIVNAAQFIENLG